MLTHLCIAVVNHLGNSSSRQLENIIITRNYRHIWFPNYQMRWLVLYIVGGVNGQIALSEHVHVDYLTTKRAIIASNAEKSLTCMISNEVRFIVSARWIYTKR